MRTEMREKYCRCVVVCDEISKGLFLKMIHAPGCTSETLLL